jgi:hypothetical protein
MSQAKGFGGLSSGFLEPQFATLRSLRDAPYHTDKPDPVVDGVVLTGIVAEYFA